MWPTSFATRLARETPQRVRSRGSVAAKEAGPKNVPQPGYCTIFMRNQRTPGGSILIVDQAVDVPGVGLPNQPGGFLLPGFRPLRNRSIQRIVRRKRVHSAERR